MHAFVHAQDEETHILTCMDAHEEGMPLRKGDTCVHWTKVLYVSFTDRFVGFSVELAVLLVWKYVLAVDDLILEI